MFRVSLRYRCLLSPFPQRVLPPLCICGTRLRDNPRHLLSCSAFSHTCTSLRHDPLAKGITDHATALGGVARWDREVARAKGSLIPDGYLDLHEHFMFDIATVDPCSPSNLSLGSKPLACASTAESMKLNKYGTFAAGDGSVFFGLGVELPGGLSKGWFSLFAALETWARSQPHALQLLTPDSNPATSTQLLRRAISLTLQRGNAQVACQLLRCIRRRAALPAGAADSPTACRSGTPRSMLWNCTAS